MSQRTREEVRPISVMSIELSRPEGEVDCLRFLLLLKHSRQPWRSECPLLIPPGHNLFPIVGLLSVVIFFFIARAVYLPPSDIYCK